MPTTPQKTPMNGDRKPSMIPNRVLQKVPPNQQNEKEGLKQANRKPSMIPKPVAQKPVSSKVEIKLGKAVHDGEVEEGINGKINDLFHLFVAHRLTNFMFTFQ